MSLLAPWWLLALIPVAALVGGYLLRLRSRRASAISFSNVELLRTVAPAGLGWLRRHAPPIALLVSLLALVLALARPTVPAKEPLERATVLLAIDVSLSMQAQDISPSRIAAAQAAAKDFVDQLPLSFNVGLVSFARSATVLVAPSKDRAAVKASIDGLKLAEATATGDAVFACLEAIAAVPADGAQGPPPARVVLLSDGYRTFGRSLEDAAAAAAKAAVPISTIAFGTDNGTVDIGGAAQRVPVDRNALEQLAEATGGYFYEAASSASLAQVYQDMGSSIGYRAVTKEVAEWFVAIGLLFALGAAGMSLLWSSRLV